MALTALPPSFYRPRRAEDLQPNRPAITVDSWTTAIAWFCDAPPPATGSTWQMAASIDADVDPGVIGQIRLRSSGGSISQPAYVNLYAERIVLGWEPISDAPQRVWLEAARVAGSGGGGVKIIRAALLLMQVPPAGEAPGPTYPPGYAPPVLGTYPPRYDTPDPYG